MKALVLCGGYPQKYLVELLRERGIYAIVADQNPKAPAIEIADEYRNISPLDENAVKEVAVSENVSFVLSVCADQMLLVAAKVCEDLSLPCYIDYATALKVSKKELMKKTFVEGGVPTSHYTVCDRYDPSAISHLEWPLIVKPVDCYSSRGVKKVTTEDELKTALSYAIEISRTHTAIIEEFVGGEEYSVDYFIEDGEAKVLCMRALDKIPGQDGFVICRGRYPAPASDGMKDKIREVGQRIADAFGLKNTPMLVQMKVDGERISVIEFCARTGGGIKYRLLPYVSGFDVVKAVLDITLGERPHYDGRHAEKYIVDEFLYCHSGTLDRMEGFEELLCEGVIEDYACYKQSGHEFRRAASSGDRVAYFSVEGKTLDEVTEKHRLAKSRVKALDTDGNDLIMHEIVNFLPY